MDSLNPCSQYGEKLDVVAYGEYIPTTDRMGDNGFVGNQQASKREDVCDLDPNYDCVFDGTSAAAPQVTAIAALILQKRPDLIGQADILKRILRYTAENPWGPTTDTARLNDQIGWGRVNAFEALLAVSRGDANNDGNIDVADATYIVNYIYSNGPAPQPDPRMGDANCDATVNVGDAVHIVNYIFRGGPAPCICYKDMYCD